MTGQATVEPVVLYTVLAGEIKGTADGWTARAVGMLTEGLRAKYGTALGEGAVLDLVVLACTPKPKETK